MIIFDLDGTLRDPKDRLHFIEGKTKDWDNFYLSCGADQPIRHMLENLIAFSEMGKTIEIWSGCSAIAREETEYWLAHHGIEVEGSPFEANEYAFDGRIGHVKALLMRVHWDFTPDVELKQGWLKERGLLAPPEQVEMVFDDRKSVVDMWRRNGLTCIQVAPGDF